MRYTSNPNARMPATAIISSSFLETIQAAEQPPGDREEEHCDTEKENIHRESHALLTSDVPLVASKWCQNGWANYQEKIKTGGGTRWEMGEESNRNIVTRPMNIASR